MTHDLMSDEGASGGVPPQSLLNDWDRGDIPRLGRDDQPSSRVPHVGHTLLFLILTVLFLLLAQVALMLLPHHALSAAQVTRSMQPKSLLLAQLIVYLVTLAVSVVLFPLLWARSFLDGINWNGSRALRHAVRLIPAGLALGLAVQAISTLIPMPKSIPMDDFFRSSSDIWLVALFGTLIAPLFEEIAFRGFVLPALAIAFDWVSGMLRRFSDSTGAKLAGAEPEYFVPAFPEAASAGLVTDTGNLFFRSRSAVIAASLVSSALFAMLHAEQIARAWGGLAVLFSVSLVLTAVRVRSKSVACSALVHGSYNLSVFISLFVATGGFRHLDRLSVFVVRHR